MDYHNLIIIKAFFAVICLIFCLFNLILSSMGCYVSLIILLLTLFDICFIEFYNVSLTGYIATAEPIDLPDKNDNLRKRKNSDPDNNKSLNHKKNMY